MPQMTHPAPIYGAMIPGLEDDTRYTIENTGDVPVLLIEAAAKPASVSDSDGFWLAPRPYFPAPSRKLHEPGSRPIKKVSGLDFFVWGMTGGSTVVTVEAP